MTRRAGDNFGSSLQAYALQQFLLKQGYDNRIIDYDEYPLRWKIKPFIYDRWYDCLRILPSVSENFFPARYRWLRDRNIQQKKFKAFDTAFLKLTPKHYRNSRAIEKDSHQCAACLCGSDQIWNPLFFDSAMFLDFCTNGKTKKIAYAPSIGAEEIKIHREEIKKLVNKFDCLSVREEKGASLIKELTGRKAEVVLDPTLLLDKEDWEKIMIKPTLQKPYILCYFLGYEEVPARFIQELRQQSGLDVYIATSYFYPCKIEGIRLSTLSPREFLGLVANAAYICVNSFHGTIFSILFEKQFFCFKRENTCPVQNKNSRIQTLLKMHGLTDRLLPVNSHYTPLSDIDFEKVKSLLAENRLRSISYLENALKEFLPAIK